MDVIVEQNVKLISGFSRRSLGWFRTSGSNAIAAGVLQDGTEKTVKVIKD